jgi:hypothetical protein
VHFFGKGFGKAVGKGFGHDAVIIVMVGLKLGNQLVAANTGCYGKATKIIGYAAVFWCNEIR